MKKNFIYNLFFAIIISGCSGVTNSEPQLSLGSQLESNKDIISTIETYNSVYKDCKHPDYSPDWLGRKCDTSLMKQNVEYKCFEKAAYDPKYKDKTDECILHRREIKNSEISFFDFARFIPNNTKIKTEKNFKGVAKVYEYSMIDCKERREITQQEREKCFSNVKNDIHKMVYDTKIKCTDLNILKIENEGLMYRISVLCDCDSKSKNGYKIRLADIEALQKELKDYSESYLCDISNWEQEFIKYWKKNSTEYCKYKR